MRTPPIHSRLALAVASVLVAGCTEAPDARLTAPHAPILASQTCELDVSPADAYAEIDALRAEVDALEDSGALNSGQANALRNHLDTARGHLDEGRICPALAQLRAFREQVDDFVADGVLTEAEATPLLDGADRALGDAPPLFRLASIDASSTHTCGLTATGSAYCWGEGRLGDGTLESSLIPKPVSGGHAFTSISAGGGSISGQGVTCALRADGTAYCWGFNAFGQIGDGTTTDRLVPVAVSGGHAFASISASQFSTCGVRVDGKAYCWGSNIFGQLGDGTREHRHVPTPVSGGHDFASISVGGSTTCGVRTDGAGYCWGSNAFGEIGNGTTDQSSVPTPVSGGHDLSVISVGMFRHTCALRTDGAPYCWGSNASGQIGDGTTTQRLVPVAVVGGHAFTEIFSGIAHTCGLRDDGAAYCWGLNSSGQVGDGTTDPTGVPVPVVGAHAFTSITTRGNTSCGIRTDTAAFCWGSNFWGTVGDGTTTDRLVPTPVHPPER